MDIQVANSSKYFNIYYRLSYLGIGILIFIAAYSVGAALTLNADQAEEIRRSFIEDAQGIDQIGIFLNNIEVALGMFVPGAGVGIGIFSGISTGMVYNAFALVSIELSSQSALSVLATPFGLLEIFAYGLAMSRSGMLFAQLIRKEERRLWKRYLFATVIEIALVMTALVAGSLIESQTISSAGQS